MAMAEGIDHVRRRPRRAEHRQRVGQAGAMTHPHRDPLLRVGGGETGQHLAPLLEENAGAPPIGGRLEASELDRAGKAQSGVHRRRDKLTVGIGSRDSRHDFRIADHQVIAALGFERHPVAECRGERL